MTKYFLREVFTPATPARVAFVERESINERLVSALQTPGKQIIVYGHTGSGKTTLLQNKLMQTHPNHVTTRCMKGMRFDQLIAEAFVSSNALAVSSVEVKKSEATTARIGKKSFFGIEVESGTDTTLKKSAIVAPNSTIQQLGRTLGEAGACWLLEDFHKIEAEERLKLAQAMKLFMDMAAEFPDLKVIAIGAVDSARHVVECDPEMRNRVAEISVPLMNEYELLDIVAKGARALNCRVDPQYSRGMALLSNGLPAVMHQLCLHYFEQNHVTETQEHLASLGVNGYQQAIACYVEESSDTLKKAFDGALVKNRRAKEDHFSLILRALTKFSQDGAQGFEILEKIKELKPGYNASNFQRHLKTLTTPARHNILRFESNSQRFSFAEPIFRAFAAAFFAKERGAQLDTQLPNQIDLLLRTLVPDIVRALARIEATGKRPPLMGN